MDDLLFPAFVIAGAVMLVKVAIFVGVAVVIVRALKRKSEHEQDASPLGPGSAVGGDFTLQLMAIHTLIQEANKTRDSSGFVPSHTANQFQLQLMRAQREMRQMDRLSRQRHETFVSGMLSDATAAGLDVSRWNIR